MKKTRSFRWLLRTSVFCVALPLATLLIANDGSQEINPSACAA